MKLTIDASVFVAAARPSEPHFNEMLQSKIPSVEIRSPIEWLLANPPNLVSS